MPEVKVKMKKTVTRLGGYCDDAKKGGEEATLKEGSTWPLRFSLGGNCIVEAKGDTTGECVQVPLMQGEWTTA